MYKLQTGEFVSLENLKGVTRNENGCHLIFTYNDRTQIMTGEYRKLNYTSSELIKEELEKIYKEVKNYDSKSK